MIRFILTIFLILFVNLHTMADVIPSGEGMRSVLSEKNSAEIAKDKKKNKVLNYLRADYLVYLVLITSGAYILIRKRKSKNIHL